MTDDAVTILHANADSATVRRVKEALDDSDMSNFSLHCVSSVEQAAAFLESHVVDILLLDLSWGRILSAGRNPDFDPIRTSGKAVG